MIESITQFKEALREDIRDWADHYEVGFPGDSVLDLVDTITDRVVGTIKEVRGLPNTCENDDEHYND